MRKVLTFLGASLALTWVVQAGAQTAPDMFKDLDTNHWAYAAVESLRSKNIVVGYPDGYFRGKRTLTRYEFAVALDRALKQMSGGAGGVGPAGPQGAQGPQGPAGPQGEQGLIGPPGMTPEEVATLRRLIQEFKDELAGLGNNIAALNRRVGALEDAVRAINARLDRMPRITGGAFFGIRSDRASGGYVDKDGRVFGIGTSAGSGLVNTPAVVNDFRVGIAANIAGGATLDAELTSNNYKNFLGGNTAQIGPVNRRPVGDTYLHHLEIKTPFTGIGRGSSLTLGRFGHRLGHLTLWKPDVDTYFANPFEDDGKYYMDGVRLNTNFGSVSVEIAGGQTMSANGMTNANTGTIGGGVFSMPWNSPIAGSAGYGLGGGNLFGAFGPFAGNVKPFGQVNNGAMTVDQLVSVALGYNHNLLGGGHAGFTAASFSAENTVNYGAGFTTVHVLGANADFKLAERLLLGLDWGKTITSAGRFNSVTTRDNNAFNGTIGWTSGGLNINGGYKYIDPLFYAPGYWGRIGNWINPTNIQGPTVRAAYDFSPAFGVNVGGDFFSAARNRGAQGGLTMNDDISRILVGLRWDVAKNFRTTVDWEGVYWKLQGSRPGLAIGGGTIHPTEHYITLGTGYNLTSNTMLKLNYQIGDFNGHGSLNGGAGTKYNFNTFTGQVAVKF